MRDPASAGFFFAREGPLLAVSCRLEILVYLLIE